MYIGEEKVKNIDNDTVEFENGNIKKFTTKALEYLVTDESVEERDFHEKLDLLMLDKIFSIIGKSDVVKAFDETEGKQTQTDTVAELVKLLTEYDFPISKLGVIFQYMKSYIGAIETILQNNIKNLDDDLVIKMLGADNEGNSNGEKLRNIRMSHYLNVLKKN